jgi:hypothetical protein
MDTKIAKSMICLYSKFSQNSTKFLDLSKSYNLPLEYVCIDNKNIRNRIIKNKKILIYSVPCLLFIYDNGVLEKYEGYNAFEWINDVIKNIEKATIENNNNINNNINSTINNVEKLEVEKSKNKIVAVASKKVSKNPNPPSTPIDLLDDESENENIDKNIEEINEEDEEDEDEELFNNIEKPARDIDISGFNSSKVSSGIENKNNKKDVMSLARELEKQRETEENSGKKNRKNI